MKPFLCRIGAHLTFYDSVGTNVGTEQMPVYVMQTYRTCERCGHREPVL